MLPTAEALRKALAGRAYKPWEGEGVERHAAVAALFRQSDPEIGLEVLLIRRAESSSDPWSGHMAFPGGRRDPSDADLFATVIRETREEIQVDLGEHGEFLGRLDDVPAIGRARFTGMVIAPFVFLVAPNVQGSKSGEVAEVFWSPMRRLMSSEAKCTQTYMHEGRVVELPAIDVEGRRVWGLTLHMLSTIFGLLGGPTLTSL